MASKTAVTRIRRALRNKRVGRKNKNRRQNRGTTLPAWKLFQDPEPANGSGAVPRE